MPENKNNIQNMADEELVGLARSNPEFFVFIIERYEKKILRFIKRISSASRETAEDLGQETFIKVYQRINQFDEKRKFSSWLYGIARNHVISHWRKHKKEKEVLYWNDSDNFERILEGDEDLVQRTDDQILQKKLTVILENLKPIHKEVLVLKYLEDRDYQEIGEIVRRPIGSVGVLISRAKAELKEKLSKNIIFRDDDV